MCIRDSFISSPVIFYQAWQFISAGLLEKEKKPVVTYTFLSLFLFAGGILFAYFIILPLAVKFLLGFATPTLRPFLSVGQYISFVGILLRIFGLSFEVPLVVLFLNRIGLVSLETLRKNRRTVIVVIFVLAAVFTPPDVITQVFLAAPLIVLYELGILLARISK